MIWESFWGYPIDWSIQLSKMDNEIGKEHERRLEVFDNILGGDNNE